MNKEDLIMMGFLRYEDSLAYPALIAKKLNGQVSKAWVGEICKGLKKRGILGHKMMKPPRREKTRHYYLKRDIGSFKKLAELVLKGGSVGCDWFMYSPFVQKQIDAILVENVLNGKKVQFENNEKTVLPILSMIKISNSALSEFLLGNWNPYNNKYYKKDGFGDISHLLFRLMLFTMNDIVKRQRSLHTTALVENAWIRGGNLMDIEVEDSLFGIKLKDGHIIHFDGGTDTTHWITDDGFPYEKKTNPENCWIKILVEEPEKGKKTDFDILEYNLKWREGKPKILNFPDIARVL